MTIRQWLITSGDIPCKSSQWGQERELMLWMKGGGESAGGGLVSLSPARVSLQSLHSCAKTNFPTGSIGGLW